MLCSPKKKTKSTPARLASLHSRPYPFHAPHPLPQRTNAQRPPPLGAPNARKFDGHLPHPGEIHGATRLRRDPWRWRDGVAGEWTALLYPDAAPSPPRRRPLSPLRLSSPHLGGHDAPRPQPPPSPPSQARYWWRLVSVVLVRRRSPLALTSTAGIDWPWLPLPYVANVYFMCFSCFKGTLQLFFYGCCKSR